MEDKISQELQEKPGLFVIIKQEGIFSEYKLVMAQVLQVLGLWSFAQYRFANHRVFAQKFANYNERMRVRRVRLVHWRIVSLVSAQPRRVRLVGTHIMVRLG